MASYELSFALARARSRKEYRLPAKSVYLPMDYKWRGHKGSVWSDVIADHPEIANDWTDLDLEEMKALLSGTVMILDGKLRLMPSHPEAMKVELTVSGVNEKIARMTGHIEEGRIPVLKEATKMLLVERAEQYEILRYGRTLDRLPFKEDPQKELF